MPSHTESVRYIKFLEDTGVEQIGSLLRWVYYRKKAENGSFDLYSDIDSRIKHLNRIIFLILPFLIMEMIFGLNNLSLYFNLKTEISIYAGFFCLLIAALMGYGCIKILTKKNKLKKERLLHD